MQLSADSRSVVSEVESGNSEYPLLHRNYDGTVQTNHNSSIHVPGCILCTDVCSGFLQAILVPEASEFSQWEPEGAESGCPVTAVIPVWRNLTTLDMSHNCISTIDSSVVRHAHQTSTQHVLPFPPALIGQLAVVSGCDTTIFVLTQG